jgi:formamidopyrimidine-DNA glycosylase
MPELPEVELTKRKLEILIGKTFRDFWTDWPRGFKSSFSPAETARDLNGRKILHVYRRGKVVLFDIGTPGSNKYEHEERLLAFHQRMSGSFRILPPGSLPIKGRSSETDASAGIHEKHVHVKITFSDGTVLWFRDPRKFGVVWYGLPEEVLAFPYFKKLGTDALEVSRSEFKDLLKKHKGMLKPVLLRQDFLAGIGNIIADETIWGARLHPRRLVSSITPREADALFESLQGVLHRSIAAKGSTLQDWQDPDGERGQFQTITNVYERKGQPCRRGNCKGKIERIVVGGRGTWVCGGCQTI